MLNHKSMRSRYSFLATVLQIQQQLHLTTSSPSILVAGSAVRKYARCNFLLTGSDLLPQSDRCKFGVNAWHFGLETTSLSSLTFTVAQSCPLNMRILSRTRRTSFCARFPRASNPRTVPVHKPDLSFYYNHRHSFHSQLSLLAHHTVPTFLAQCHHLPRYNLLMIGQISNLHNIPKKKLVSISFRFGQKRRFLIATFSSTKSV